MYLQDKLHLGFYRYFYLSWQLEKLISCALDLDAQYSCIIDQMVEIFIKPWNESTF